MSNYFLLEQVFRVPPVTRCIAISIVLVTLLVYTDTVSPYSLFYSPLFLKKFEVWRVFTTFLYFGKPTLDVFMHIVFLYRYSKMLEEGCINTSDYFWMILVISSILFVISNIYGIPTLGTSFSSTITYIWTKRNPRAIVQIFGFISFPAFYLPFILPGFMLLSRRSISIDDILGIAVGHVFYYFRDVYPRWGRNVFATPCWVKRIFNEHPVNCCIDSKKGTTIREGRAKYEKSRAQSSMVDEDKTSVAEDTIITGTDGDAYNESINNVLDKDAGSSIILNSTVLPQENSIMSASKAHEESTEMSEEDPGSNQEKSESQDDWRESWASDSSTRSD